MSKIPNFSQFVSEDARLRILIALEQDTDGEMNSTLLSAVLDRMAHSLSSARLEQELVWLEAKGLVVLERIGPLSVVRLTALGLDVAQRRERVEGILPRRPGE
jgi:hypothetical protein